MKKFKVTFYQTGGNYIVFQVQADRLEKILPRIERYLEEINRKFKSQTGKEYEWILNKIEEISEGKA